MSINICCPINNTGYGIASVNILKELAKLDNNISLFPIGQSYANSQEEYDLLLKMMNNSSSSIDPSAPYVKIWHQFDLLQRHGTGKYFAFPFFELDTFNTLEKLHLSVPHELFVTSQWAKDIISHNNIITKTNIVPLGVDTEIFKFDKYETSKNKDKYIFLNIGKWEIRKGHDILLDLFNEAFPTERDVELWVLASETTNSYSSKEELDKWKAMYSSSNRVKLFSGANTHEDIASLISQCDCGIYPSRAEGWNLELLETMAMNKPTIATRYSAHTEFCNDNNCYLVDVAEKEFAQDGKAFIGQGYWAKLGKNQFDQIIEHMRYVYKNRINTNIEGVKTANKFNWANSASQLYRCISD